jgi:hypothetical protein
MMRRDPFRLSFVRHALLPGFLPDSRLRLRIRHVSRAQRGKGSTKPNGRHAPEVRIGGSFAGLVLRARLLTNRPTMRVLPPNKEAVVI